jgi:hypothetical protein
VPITVAPASRASCVAGTPTPPLAPWINTVSPARSAAFWNSARHAVAHGTPIAAPCG